MDGFDSGEIKKGKKNSSLCIVKKLMRLLRYFSFLTVMSDGQRCPANKKENRTYRLRGNGKIDCFSAPTTFAEQDIILPVYDRFQSPTCA